MTTATHRWATGALALGWLLTGTPVHGQALADVELSWDGPPQCADASGVLSEARRLLGAFRGGRERSFEVELEPHEGQLRLSLELDGEGASGERELLVGSCAEARQTAALLIALALDPDAVQAQRQAPEPAADSAEGTRIGGDGVELAVELVGDSASLGANAGAGVSLGWRLGALSLHSGARLWLPRIHEPAGNELAQVRLWLLTGGAGACLTPALGAVAVGGCTELELGVLIARADHAMAPRDANELWAAWSAGPRGLWWLGPQLSIALDLRAVLPWTRPRFALRGVGDVFTPPQLAGRAAISVSWQFR